MAEITTEDVTNTLKDAAYVAIGFGVLTLQRAQVQRQELTKQVKGQIDEARETLDKVSADTSAQLTKVSDTVDNRVKLLEERLDELESRLDNVLDEVQAKLPEQAAELVKQARDVAKDARTQVRSFVGRAA